MMRNTRLTKTMLTTTALVLGLMLTGCTTFGSSLGERARLRMPASQPAPVMVIDHSEAIETTETVEDITFDEVVLSEGSFVNPTDPKQLVKRGLKMSGESRYGDSEALISMAEDLAKPGNRFQISCRFARANLLYRLGRGPEATAILEELNRTMDPITRSELNIQERTLLAIADLAAGRPYVPNVHPEQLRDLFRN